MSFNLQNFLDAFEATLPAVGAAVIALHPDNPNEALKIQVGTQLIQMFAASLHQVATSAPAVTPIPASAPAPVQGGADPAGAPTPASVPA